MYCNYILLKVKITQNIIFNYNYARHRHGLSESLELKITILYYLLYFLTPIMTQDPTSKRKATNQTVIVL